MEHCFGDRGSKKSSGAECYVRSVRRKLKRIAASTVNINKWLPLVTAILKKFTYIIAEKCGRFAVKYIYFDSNSLQMFFIVKIELLL